MVLSRSSSTAYLRLCILSALGMVAVSATAATNDLAMADDNALPKVELDEIVVTATRTPTKTSNVIAQTRVIDKEELQRYQGQTVVDVLKNQSGINISQSGGIGTISNFYMRGYDSKQVLVIIDGIRYSSISTGTPSLNLLSADQIDRIEILYGASGSSIYGSDAMGGVIQIFTKGSNVEQSNVSTTIGYGSHNHYQVGVTGQLKNDTSSLSLGVSRNKTDGFNAIANSNSFDYNADDDGFKSTNASLGLQHKLSNSLSAGLSALYSDSTTDIDSAGNTFPNAYSDQKNGSTNAFIQHQTPLTVTKLSYGQSIDKLTSHDNNSINYQDGSQFDTTQEQARLESQINAQPGTVTVGAEWLSQKLDASDVLDFSGFPAPAVQTAYDPDDRTVKSAFVGYQLSESYYDLQANYRVDDNSQYGNESTYNVGAAVRPLDGVRIGASYATGFRAPTFNDLYYPGYNNPDLKPETSKNTEVFVEYNKGKQISRLTGYHTDVEDLIGGNTNTGEAQIKGISLTSDWRVDSFLFGLGYDYLDAKNKTANSTNYNNDLVYRPQNSGLIYVGYQQPTFDVRLEAKHTDDRFSDATNQTKLDSYTLVNLSGSIYIQPNLRANLRVDNLTDEDYTLSNQFGTEYATDGINYFTSLTYNWF
ncbi:TonB-dependent receptor plug domain-containing protein [Psychrobacter aquaticus]|uniref:Outer membrane vitamin B12 receptor BtuB n=1 Tax=Psychrobacter aquaticus CMS 56 TaxID=1354303 RepID=U4T1D5_9GAMM|nr:TonB-dependent receptor [Psychrobacter aquaticus]ERL54522.1 Outer membrane vitamin B12 receptor BtuB [Psychrobacter aquaticus CMS 56]